ncbi:deoxyribose-phosphate aldolase [Oceanobacillus kimchii]|uniref:deoxyribose-phosphate aldolase n=1 Tax=Oceanobacillus kimchii TaxID=746691 RepID=UPI0023311124|nr:deoxyribose-phosphate aldolase [Oceanobacillus kimchii]
MEKSDLIKIIDYTLLHPTSSKSEIESFVQEVVDYGFKTIFVQPYYVPFAVNWLAEHDVKVGVPVGFSLGGATTHVKVEETKEAIRNGAEEIDMLVNLGALKPGDYQTVEADIASVVEAANGLNTKVIIETALLNQEEKVNVTECIIRAGADFVKTATGFNGGGATVEDVRLLNEVGKGKIQVKAAGGIKTYEDALAIIDAGATRIGSSGAVQIIRGETSTSSY